MTKNNAFWGTGEMAYVDQSTSLQAQRLESPAPTQKAGHSCTCLQLQHCLADMTSRELTGSPEQLELWISGSSTHKAEREWGTHLMSCSSVCLGTHRNISCTLPCSPPHSRAYYSKRLEGLEENKAGKGAGPLGFSWTLLFSLVKLLIII